MQAYILEGQGHENVPGKLTRASRITENKGAVPQNSTTTHRSHVHQGAKLEECEESQVTPDNLKIPSVLYSVSHCNTCSYASIKDLLALDRR